MAAQRAAAAPRALSGHEEGHDPRPEIEPVQHHIATSINAIRMNQNSFHIRLPIARSQHRLDPLGRRAVQEVRARAFNLAPQEEQEEDRSARCTCP